MAPQFNLIGEPTIARGFYPIGAHDMTIIPPLTWGRPFLILRVHGNRYYGRSWYETRKVQPIVRYEAN